VDVGAWIGPLTLFAATRCRRVYAIEPDPEAYRTMLANLERNRLGNVVPFQVSLGARTGTRRMAVVEGKLGNSLTRLSSGDAATEEIEVSGMSWTDWMKLANPDPPALIKIDIEGGEFELVPAMKEYLESARPPLLLSLHAPLLPEKERERSLVALRDALLVYRFPAEDLTRFTTVLLLAE
jgi:FkbM family methyltransferase